LRVAVLSGGRSSEHEVSLASGAAVRAGLADAGHEVLDVHLTREGAWLHDGEALALLPGGGLLGAEAAFPVLHGPFGEDGTVQGLLELLGVPYVGAGVLASALCMDKVVFKDLLAGAGIPQVAYAAVRPGETPDLTDLGLPVFVKPARAGSSYGISKVSDWAQLDAAIAIARAIDPKVVVEAAIVGREVECGVLEGEYGGAPEASLLAEVRVGRDHEFYDFEAKYLDDSCEFDIPADLPERVTAQVQAYACRTFSALDCAGLARVDFFVTPELDVYLNEINTMPGFTATSMFPRMWAATGLEYPKLTARLIRTALRRGPGLH
jgi:D-alanine-D-alanine ligase